MKADMRIKSDVYSITLNNTKAAKDFAAMMPITLTLEDYAGSEKINDLPSRLDRSDSPAGTDAKKGDIAYYAPWGNIALFYGDARFAHGLVALGKIDEGSKMLSLYGNRFEATFEISE